MARGHEQHITLCHLQKDSPNQLLTNTAVAIHIQVEAKGALAAVTQAVVVGSVAEDTDLFAASIVISTWVAGWRKKCTG